MLVANPAAFALASVTNLTAAQLQVIALALTNSSAFDTNGAWKVGTNGYPWGNLYAAVGVTNLTPAQFQIIALALTNPAAFASASSTNLGGLRSGNTGNAGLSASGTNAVGFVTLSTISNGFTFDGGQGPVSEQSYQGMLWETAQYGYVLKWNGGNSVMGPDGQLTSMALAQDNQDAHSGGRMQYVSFLAWGAPDNMWHHNLSQVAYTSFSAYPGGSDGLLEDNPVDPAENSLALPVPPLVLTAYQGVGSNTNEAALTNIVYQSFTNGIPQAVAAAGGKLLLHMDDNTTRYYFNTNLDSDWFPSINLTAFPDGTNFSTIVSNYGFGLMGTVYWYPFPTNVAYENYAGMQSAWNAPFAMTPNNVSQFISKFYDFGWAGLRVADGGSGYGYYSQASRMTADNILNPWTSGGGNRQKYPFMNTNLNKGALTPMVLEMLTVDTGNTPTFIYRQANIIDHDQAGNYPGAIPPGNTLVQMMNILREQYNFERPFRRVGHYGADTVAFFNGDQTVLNTRNDLTICAIMLDQVQYGFKSTEILAAVRPNFLANITNTNYLSVLFDPYCLPPIKAYDYGISNLSVYARPLGSGAIAVALFNETNAATNMTFTLASVGANPGLSYSVYSVWDGASLGNRQGSFTYTNVPSLGCELLLLKPTVAAYVDGSTNTIIPGGLIVSNTSPANPAPNLAGSGSPMGFYNNGSNIGIAINGAAVGFLNSAGWNLLGNRGFIAGPTAGGNPAFTTSAGTNFVVDTSGNGLYAGVNLTNGSVIIPGALTVSGNGFLIRSNTAVAPVAGYTYFWNSNNAAMFSIRVGATNFLFNL